MEPTIIKLERGGVTLLAWLFFFLCVCYLFFYLVCNFFLNQLIS